MNTKDGPSYRENKGADPEIAHIGYCRGGYKEPVETRKAVLNFCSRLALILLMVSCLSSCLHLLGLDRYMSEEQKKEYEKLQKMGRVIIKNDTSSTVYLVVDYTDYGNIPAGKRAFVTVPAGGHTLEAYDRNGHVVARVRIWLGEYERYHWNIGG